MSFVDNGSMHSKNNALVSEHEFSETDEVSLETQQDADPSSTSKASVTETSALVERDLLARAVLEINKRDVRFTGEQFVPGAGVQICYEHFHRYAFASQFIPEDAVVLDLGAGVGYGSIFLSTRCKKVYALDRDGGCIAALKDVVQALEIPNITPLQGDALALESDDRLAPGEIDVIVCHEFIEHIDEVSREALLAAVRAGKGPFRKDTIFLVSTPERTHYSETRDEPNPYHLSELSLDEFKDLLSRNFSTLSLYWQGSATADGIYPVENHDNLEKKDSVHFMEWLDSHRLLGTIASKESRPGVYLYAAAANSPIPSIPHSSVLLDVTRRSEMEAMSLAAIELRTLQQKVQHLSNSLRFATKQLETREEMLVALQKEVSDAKVIREGLESDLDLQSGKIQRLLDVNEDSGANLEKTKKENARNVAEVQAELEQWRNLCISRLGPNIEAANHQIDVFRSYVDAMGSPGHRAVSYLGRKVGQGKIGRIARKLVNLLIALKQA